MPDLHTTLRNCLIIEVARDYQIPELPGHANKEAVEAAVDNLMRLVDILIRQRQAEVLSLALHRLHSVEPGSVRTALENLRAEVLI